MEEGMLNHIFVRNQRGHRKYRRIMLEKVQSKGFDRIIEEIAKLRPDLLRDEIEHELLKFLLDFS